jgi:serine O-acetyltransferase
MIEASSQVDVYQALKADTYREYGRFNWTLVIKGVLLRRSFRPIVTLRLAQKCRNGPPMVRALMLPLARAFHRITCQWAGMDLPWETSIGPGLSLTHGWGLVVSPGAVVGRNVTLFHGVTLGRRDRIASDGVRTPGYPTIEDEVWIGPHAIIVGNVVIGRGSRIAGGACVFNTVPPYSIVVGNPAEIVKSNCNPDVPNRFAG